MNLLDSFANPSEAVFTLGAWAPAQCAAFRHCVLTQAPFSARVQRGDLQQEHCARILL